jgi:hypothetical protein
VALYQIVLPGGIKNTLTGVVFFPGDAQWVLYEEWLALGNIPDAHVTPVQPIALQRVEARARLNVVVLERAEAILSLGVTAAGSRWALGPTSTMVYLVQQVRSNPFGTLRLPDVDGVFRNVTKNQLQDIVDAVANYHRALLTWAEVKRTLIDVSPVPLTIVLTDFQLPPRTACASCSCSLPSRPVARSSWETTTRWKPTRTRTPAPPWR